ncbi:MAG TPA: hypothetical protein VNL71_14510 [Chloroflexota bacterium]|nr:hypothetical protein [Chloroflexota bacterium]
MSQILECPPLTVPCRPETVLLLLERYADSPREVITETLEVEHWVWSLGPSPLPFARSLRMMTGPLVGCVVQCAGRVQANSTTQVRLTMDLPPGSLRSFLQRRATGYRCLHELATDLEDLLKPPFTTRSVPRTRLPGKVTLSLGIHQYLGELVDATAFGIGVILPSWSAGTQLLLPRQTIQVTIRRLGWSTIETTMIVAHVTDRANNWFVGVQSIDELPGLTVDLRPA